VIGIAGSAYGHCTPTGKVQGNILLDFSEDDPLLLVGRMCLAITITLAFPMLTIPARDIVIRSFLPACARRCCCLRRRRRAGDGNSARANGGNVTSVDNLLQEPLLEAERSDVEDQDDILDSSSDEEIAAAESTSTVDASFCLRLGTAVAVFWSAAAVASCVASIDVVWDLLGSSLSILLSYLIPCGSYLVIVNKFGDSGGPHDLSSKRISKKMAWILIVVFFPLMIISTANAVYDTFFNKQ